jgi:osmotically-inducible protein OsmY
MKSILIALTCVFTASACAAVKSKPNQEPSSGYNSSGPKQDGSTDSSSIAERGAYEQTKNADNTKVNERDRHTSTLTPMDQGNSGSEMKISADIRKGIMDDPTLSFTAKNVKIITVGTKVTLRGPVKSAQEKETIESVAKRAVGVGEIDNQLEVLN